MKQIPKQFEFPSSTVFGKIIAKEKIFKQNNTPVSIKKLFQQQIERIYCSYEITEEKTNLKSSVEVPKILIIQLKAKTDYIDLAILKTIDKSFRVPIVFELILQDKMRYIATYRLRNEQDKTAWVFGNYYFSSWINLNLEKQPLPVALNLTKLYQQIIYKIIGIESSKNIIQLMEKVDLINKLEKGKKTIELKRKKEKQFNRRVELNRTLNELKTEIKDLKR